MKTYKTRPIKNKEIKKKNEHTQVTIIKFFFSRFIPTKDISEITDLEPLRTSPGIK